ncbi:MAG: hypothetical protein CR955_00565 [Thiotrichales bacterium]|nr:MAG: hypothetical protein CR955_00565 [Thiotrichales bacterium]
MNNDEQLRLLKKINRRTRFTQFLAWLALFFTAVGIAAGYKNWLRIHDKAKLSLKQIEEIRGDMPDFAKKSKVQLLEQEINDNIKENKTHLNKAMHELRSIQDSTQHIAETVHIQVEQLTKQQAPIIPQTPTINDWSLGEVHFLLQTARQSFKLKKDKMGAMTALKLADDLLLKRGAIELLPVRKQISDDIATVKQFKVADIGLLSKKIDTLMLQLKPVINKPIETGKKIELLPSDANNTATESDKRAKKDHSSLVDRVKNTINNAVIIKKFDKPLLEEMNVEAKENLFQLLSLHLETLRILLLQGDNDNYHKQISRIKTLLKKYYSEPDVLKYNKQLDALSKVNLAPEVPDISSLKLLEKLMAKTNSTDSNQTTEAIEQGTE